MMTQQHRTYDSLDGHSLADFIATLHRVCQQRSLREMVHQG
jgi:hypothetical protein